MVMMVLMTIFLSGFYPPRPNKARLFADPLCRIRERV